MIWDGVPKPDSPWEEFIRINSLEINKYKFAGTTSGGGRSFS